MAPVDFAALFAGITAGQVIAALVVAAAGSIGTAYLLERVIFRSPGR